MIQENRRAGHQMHFVLFLRNRKAVLIGKEIILFFVYNSNQTAYRQYLAFPKDS